MRKSIGGAAGAEAREWHEKQQWHQRFGSSEGNSKSNSEDNSEDNSNNDAAAIEQC